MFLFGLQILSPGPGQRRLLGALHARTALELANQATDALEFLPVCGVVGGFGVFLVIFLAVFWWVLECFFVFSAVFWWVLECFLVAFWRFLGVFWGALGEKTPKNEGKRGWFFFGGGRREGRKEIDGFWFV